MAIRAFSAIFPTFRRHFEMPTHLDTGRHGEQIAVEFLQNKGWRIAERNWRLGRGEIDVIACI